MKTKCFIVHLLNGLVQLVCHEPYEREDDEPRVERGRAVCAGDDDGVAEHVVVELVVGGEGDEAAPAGTEGEEDLDGSVGPHLEIKEKNNLQRKNVFFVKIRGSFCKILPYIKCKNIFNLLKITCNRQF